MLTLRSQIAEEILRVGVVGVSAIAVSESPAPLQQLIQDQVAAAAAGNSVSAETKAAVRDMLRSGGFKPSGRSKPASEYLLQAAAESRFPAINNLVDINNLLSLKSGLPMSLLVRKLEHEQLLMRYGAPGEQYVFNSAGHAIDLNGLISVCALGYADAVPLGRPIGNPIKDSMEGKIDSGTAAVFAVIYAPAARVSKGALDEILAEYAELLQSFGQAQGIEVLQQ